MMKTIPLTAVLIGVLLLSSLACLAIGHRTVGTRTAAKQLRDYTAALEGQVMLMGRNYAVFQALVNDASEYAKKNQTMAGLLQQYAPAFQALRAHAQTGSSSTNSTRR